MATRSKSSSPRRRSTLLTKIKDHPVAAAGIAGSAVIGAVLAAKAANTASKVVTIRAAGNAAADVTRAVGSTIKKPSRRKGRASKARPRVSRGRRKVT
jgi:hypothetical protein